LQFAPRGAIALSRSELATCSAVHFVKHHRTPPIQKPIYAARRLLGCGYFWDHILKVKVENICYGNLFDFSLLSGNDVTCSDEFRKRSFSALAVAFAAPSAKLASVVEDNPDTFFGAAGLRKASWLSVPKSGWLGVTRHVSSILSISFRDVRCFPPTSQAIKRPALICFRNALTVTEPSGNAIFAAVSSRIGICFSILAGVILQSS
jgi:hypothetical protein